MDMRPTLHYHSASPSREGGTVLVVFVVVGLLGKFCKDKLNVATDGIAFFISIVVLPDAYKWLEEKDWVYASKVGFLIVGLLLLDSYRMHIRGTKFVCYYR